MLIFHKTIIKSISKSEKSISKYLRLELITKNKEKFKVYMPETSVTKPAVSNLIQSKSHHRHTSKNENIFEKKNAKNNQTMLVCRVRSGTIK